MKASEALALGRLITPNPEAGNINSCALGMMLNALGIPPVDNWRTFDNHRLTAVKANYPWMSRAIPPELKRPPSSVWDCALWGNWIAVTFNESVMRSGIMTLDQLQAIIAENEPQCGICNQFDCTCPTPAPAEKFDVDKEIDNPASLVVQEHIVETRILTEVR